MNIKNIKFIVWGLALGAMLTACDDFLDHPDEDNPSMDNYFRNDTEVKNSVLSLYSSVWNDFVSRGYYRMGDILAGNVWPSGVTDYVTFSYYGKDAIEDRASTANSLWNANSHANTIYTYLKSAQCSEEVRNATMGECLAWKAMAYFYLVRLFGEVPIVHDNTADMQANTYNDKPLVLRNDVYEYIILTLEKAIELLPEKNEAGRIDKWGAKGLLAKVYLTKSGVNAGGNGPRNQADLDKAAEYAKDVIKNSGKILMPNYADIFKGENNFCDESLMGWRWNCSPDIYTCANPLGSELIMDGFTGSFSWGGWVGPSVDLFIAFGIDPYTEPTQRIDVDSRRKATFMMAGDTYDYFWRDKTYNNPINGIGKGFDYLQFLYDEDYYCDDNYKGVKKNGLQSNHGANFVKHQYGNKKDHETMFGQTPDQQRSSMSTHLLRLADVYLIYAEAIIGNNNTTTDADAIDAFYQVRHRAVSSYTKPASISLDDVLKERRLEFALEGDYWYDLVRMSYYNMEGAMDIIRNQKRGYLNKADENLSDIYKKYWDTKGESWDGTPTPINKLNDYVYVPTTIDVKESIFTIPMPTEDAEYNPMLLQPAVHVDVRATYSY
ncbi:MAG: RagB/SusD family nutrient uptake outer membrane protein [Prevotella sp.]|nr:RagB/SusD family nutrient uptake outer membrane protein [Prevotella sp.]MBO6191003.1 RagB/SusD family nutrient uptake outer membrane protein [Prevotella sp.]